MISGNGSGGGGQQILGGVKRARSAINFGILMNAKSISLKAREWLLFRSCALAH